MSHPVPASVPALVTGASSGIGEEFACQLAARGHDVVVVARRADRLESLARELSAAHGTRVEVLAADLESAEGRELVVRRLTAGGEPWVLVNNAGFGSRGRFVELPPERERAETFVNVVAPLELTAAALPACVAAGTGGVLNVASTAAFQPLPYMATYAATKAYVLHLTEALAVETRNTGVHVTALCPGPVRTEFGELAGVGTELDMAMPMTPSKVVATALRAFDRNQTICIPGAVNALGAIAARISPRFLTRRVAAPIFRPR